MKRKGFTLIELLAVIIILAIIALIATPIVLDVIEDSKESVRKSSLAGYANTVRLKAATKWFHDGSYPAIDETFLNEVENEYQGDRIVCEKVYYSSQYETVLHNCKVGGNNKAYYLAGNQIYESAEDATYKSIYESVKEPDLAEILIRQYKTTNAVGLLKDSTGYYYKGTNTEVSNNYVWFAGHLWRVISIDNDNNITMITQQPLTTIQLASSSWRTQAQYEASYINKWLNNLTNGVFLKSMEASDRNKILTSTFNVGGEYNDTTKVVEDIDKIQTTQKVGLLDEEQYKRAGDGTTGKDSFLDIKDYFWLGNRSGTSYMRSVFNSGGFGDGSVSGTFGVRPVIKISALTFTEGEGTLANPYRENSTTTNTSNIKVGEYISVSTTGTECGNDNRCLFRVVGKDSDSIKVVLNGLLPSKSQFGSTATYTANNTVDIRVKAFANTIDSTYRYTGNKTFGIGKYAYGANYVVLQSPTYTGNVGLPVVGEMFSGNDIDLSTSAIKTFVNAETIENPTVASSLLAMNAYSTDYVGCIMDGGSLCGGYYTHGYTSGVRPVLFLNQGLTLTRGEGTAENPFMLGE